MESLPGQVQAFCPVPLQGQRAAASVARCLATSAGRSIGALPPTCIQQLSSMDWHILIDDLPYHGAREERRGLARDPLQKGLGKSLLNKC